MNDRANILSIFQKVENIKNAKSYEDCPLLLDVK